MTERLHLTCRCGAALDLTVNYAATLRVEREKFDEAHAICREQSAPEAEPIEHRRLCDPMPGGYLLSTPRDMPRGALSEPLDEGPPPPPERPDPLPDPVVPSP